MTENVLVLTKSLEEMKLRETLSRSLTNVKQYEGDYKLFHAFCDSLGFLVDSESLVYYLHHSLKEQRVKKNTFNRRYFACKKMLELDGHVLTNNQIEQVKLLRKHYRTEEHAAQAVVKGKKALDSEDLLYTIGQIDNVRTKAILYVQLYTACRPSEMVILKVSDFDLDNGNVNVYLRKQKEYTEKRLPLICVNAIRDYIKAHQLQVDDYFVGTINKYGTYKSREISLSGYNLFLRNVIGLSAYNFRKTLVSRMHNNGASLEIIQKQTGHGSTRTIAEHYLKVDKTMVDKFL